MKNKENKYKTVYLVNGAPRKRGRPGKNAVQTVFKVNIPKNEAYDLNKHGLGVVCS